MGPSGRLEQGLPTLMEGARIKQSSRARGERRDGWAEAVRPTLLWVPLGLAVGALAGVAVTVAPSRVTVLLAGAGAYFLLLMLVANSTDPRRSAVLSMAGAATTLSWSGLSIGGSLSVGEVVPLAFLPLAIAGATDDLAYRTRRQTAALATPAVMIVGAVLASASTPGTSLAPVWIFALAALTLMTSMYVLRPSRRELNILLLGLVAGVVVSTLLGLAVLKEPSGRAIGLTVHPNQYSMAAVLALPLLWHLTRDRVLPRLVAGAGALVMVGGVLQSGSRSGLLALAVVLLVWSYREAGFYLTFGVLAAGALVLVGANAVLGLTDTPALARLLSSSETADSDAGRIALLTHELSAILDGNYILGIGFGAGRMPHNLVLLVWGGFGLLGLVFFAWLMWVLLAPALSRRSGELSAALALGCLGFTVALMLNNLIGASFFWLTAAIAFFRRREPPSSRAEPVEESVETHPPGRHLRPPERTPSLT